MTAKLEWYGDEVEKRLEQGIENGLDEAAFTLVNEAKIRLSRLGKFKSFDKQATQADRDFVANNGLVDPPGGSPRLRTGALRRAIGVGVYTKGSRERTVGVHGSLKYAAIHEFGGTINNPGGQPYIVVSDDNGQPVVRYVKKSTAARLRNVRYTKPSTTNMPARPFLRPSLDAMRSKMIEVYRRRVREALGVD
jgi:phage gpG-like protein